MFEIGDKIVYPMHGAGIIRSIEEKEIFDKISQYYLVELHYEGMEILIPVDKADSVGLRFIVDDSGIETMLEALEGPMDSPIKNWNKRYQDNLERLKTGDPVVVAQVVRNLTIMDRKKGLSSGEKRMLFSAKSFLISELMMVRGHSKQEADDLIESKINGSFED